MTKKNVKNKRQAPYKGVLNDGIVVVIAWQNYVMRSFGNLNSQKQTEWRRHFCGAITDGVLQQIFTFFSNNNNNG